MEIEFFKLVIISAEVFFAVYSAAKAVDIKTGSGDKNEILAVLFARGFYMILGIGLFCAVLKNIIELFG